LVLLFTGQLQKLTVDLSALQRVVSWARAMQVFADHPILGIGFNAWGFVQERYGYVRQYAFSYSLDGGLIFIALMTGVVGLALYLTMLAAVMRRARRIWRNPGMSAEHRGLAIGVVAGTVALMVNSLFGNSLFQPFLMETMWVLWALIFAISSGESDYTRVATT
jgi:O-antigen ligase